MALFLTLGRRVAAFGYMAGFAGSFVGLDMWCQQQITYVAGYLRQHLRLGPHVDSNAALLTLCRRPGATMGAISSYPNEDTLLTYANNRLKEASGTCLWRGLLFKYDRLEFYSVTGSIHLSPHFFPLRFPFCRLEAKAGRMPRVMVMGALGRCGTGACDLAKRAGVPE